MAAHFRRLGINVLLHIVLALLAIACRHGCGGTGAAAQATPSGSLAPQVDVTEKLVLQDKIEATTEADPSAPFITDAGLVNPDPGEPAVKVKKTPFWRRIFHRKRTANTADPQVLKTCTGILLLHRNVLTAESCCQVPGADFVPGVRVIIGGYALQEGYSTMDAFAHAASNPGGGHIYTGYSQDIRIPKTNSQGGSWGYCIIRLGHTPFNIYANMGFYSDLTAGDLFDPNPFMYTLGWGRQAVPLPSSTESALPVTRLRGFMQHPLHPDACKRFNRSTLSDWLREGLESERFLCVPPTTTSSPCVGDEGGPLVRLPTHPNRYGQVVPYVYGIYVGQVPGTPGECLAPSNVMNVYLNVGNWDVQNNMEKTMNEW